MLVTPRHQAESITDIAGSTRRAAELGDDRWARCWPNTMQSSEPAGRGGELPDVAGEFPGWLDRDSGQAAARVDGDREVHVRADDVDAVAGEDEVVPAEGVEVGGQVRDLDDSAGALSIPLVTTALVMTVRVPDTPEVTMVPLNVSLPLAAAAAGAAIAVGLPARSPD